LPEASVAKLVGSVYAVAVVPMVKEHGIAVGVPEVVGAASRWLDPIQEPPPDPDAMKYSSVPAEFTAIADGENGKALLSAVREPPIGISYKVLVDPFEATKKVSPLVSVAIGDSVTPDVEENVVKVLIAPSKTTGTSGTAAKRGPRRQSGERKQLARLRKNTNGYSEEP
jgi:hypothetical protein